jgi:methionyl-tRNA formyltransferase
VRVVILMKAAAWQPLRGDPFIKALVDVGIDVVGVVCQRTNLGSLARRVAGMTRDGRRDLARSIGVRLRGLAVRRASARAAATGPRADFRRVNVPDHNGPACLAALRDLRPDVLLLRGTDIARAPLIAAAPAVFNVHYGPLPEVRGMNAIQWSLLLGIPPAVTLHLVDTGVDTGRILLRRTIPIGGCRTLEQLSSQANRVAREVFRDGCLAWRDGTVEAQPNPAALGRQYYRMHPFLAELTQRSLEHIMRRRGIS